MLSSYVLLCAQSSYSRAFGNLNGNLAVSFPTKYHTLAAKFPAKFSKCVKVCRNFVKQLFKASLSSAEFLEQDSQGLAEDEICTRLPVRVTGPILWPFAMLVLQRLCSISAWPQAVGAIPKNLAELSFAFKFRCTVCVFTNTLELWKTSLKT